MVAEIRGSDILKPHSLRKCVLSASAVQYYIKSYIVWVIVHVKLQFAFNVVILFEIFMHLKRSVLIFVLTCK